MEEDLSITLELIVRVRHMGEGVILGKFFMPDLMVRSLYKSADMKEDLSITLEPMSRLWHMRGHFGVVLSCPS